MRHFTLQILLVLYCLPLSAFSISAGPEIFYMKRLREGGAHQDGRIDGVRLIAEHTTCKGWYMGADYFYGRGDLSGKTGSGKKLASKVTDQIVELRLGRLLQVYNPSCAYFLPFAGWGYFEEKNDFRSPSPIPFTFTDSYKYIVVGFLSGGNLSPLLSMGLDFKVRFMMDGEMKVTDDPQYEDFTLPLEKEIQVRIDLPFTCAFCFKGCPLPLQCTPFYEFRHFGGRIEYPFNIPDTKFHLWGGRVMLSYQF
ncbi:MAG: hypothetical protein K940chlam9_00489 [Chlamydiae bacterium]|nr:hypothetical protein [Chlamydiota bacterium]